MQCSGGCKISVCMVGLRHVCVVPILGESTDSQIELNVGTVKGEEQGRDDSR